MGTTTDTSASDPSKQGNNLSALLDPRGDPCVSLMNGIKIASPDPNLSEDRLAPFDVLACGAKEIKDARPFPRKVP